MDNILKSELSDVYERVEMYKKELKEHNILDEDADDLIQLYIEANFQSIHDIMLNHCYLEYNEWMKKNIEKDNSYCVWMKKNQMEENNKYLDRYNRRMKRV